ncbi:alpha/beta fold hydrolase [Stackebrandtia nassauensis]|uniref:Esterase n=1 Tax=Stackebrandtia nassauensis (strain DSM 44728 / CIP 108903 / NRRL B-16338 / NBRC 102104 / LLR-40K-21) TaxID=446470 RepID=D3PY33_STANL|nr:alpha/beta hydrolase [Stackebrandtia nassauensis]ADD45362.1 esterase [Stackebrandtia nassauensis DSM 44728]
MPEQRNHKGRTFGRRALLGATALAAAGSTALTTRTAQARPNDPTTFVLVHGANGNAASFAALTAGLAAAGHRVLPVDLPGHGPQGNFPLSYQAPQDLDGFATAPSPVLADVTLADNVRHVTKLVRRVARHGPVILLGHSMGGATITRVANEVPDLIARLIYLTAFCCVELRSVVDAFLTPEGETTLLPTIPGTGDPEQLGVNRTNWRSADPEFIDAAREALAADYDKAAFRAALNGFEPDEAAAVATDDARGHPGSWGRVPRTYIRCTADRAIPPALQDRMIDEADAATGDNRFDVRSLDAPHLGPQDPAPLLRILTRLA